MVNKAQVSLFFIFGVIIVIAVAFINYLSSIQPESEVATQAEKAVSGDRISMEAVKANIDHCVESTTKRALIYTGTHGGYYKVPEPKITEWEDDTPLYVYLNQNTILSLVTMESQISDYIKEQLPECVVGLEFEGTQLTGSINSVTTTIGKDKVIVRVDYPITIERAGTTLQISDFRVEIPSRLDMVYGVALEIVKEQLANQGALCVDCLVGLAENNNLDIDVDLEGKNLIFIIVDNTTLQDIGPFVLSFATE